jgi:AraC-like DNA-binding protein
MVCDRCINVVEQTFIRFEIPFNKISLGEVVLKHALTPKEKKLIQDEFQQVGFEIIADRNEMIVNRIKSLIINSIYEDHNYSNKNLSQILTETLSFDYSHLSSIFTKMEGKSIQAFQFTIKTERIKELLEYDEKSISEIADVLGFGSAAYLSTSFKKATGLTPSQYRMRHIRSRNTLNSL